MPYKMVVESSKQIEGVLERKYGAEGRGLHEKAESIKTELSSDCLRAIHRIATQRNKLLHEEGATIDSGRFQQDCLFVLNELGALKAADEGAQMDDAQRLFASLGLTKDADWGEVIAKKAAKGAGNLLLGLVKSRFGRS